MYTLCGAHALERGNQITENQKGWAFDSVDEKGVLVKNVQEQGWGFRSYSKHRGEKGTYNVRNHTSYFFQKQSNIYIVGLTSQNVLIF